MHGQRYRIILGVTLAIWLVLLAGSLFRLPGAANTPASMAAVPVFAAGNDPSVDHIQATTYTTADTSVPGTVSGVEKPNQSKVFFYDGIWWMMAKKQSTNLWNLWRYDSVRTWTSVFEDTYGRNKDRPDAYIDYATDRLYVFFSTDVSSGVPSALAKLSYNAGTKTWSPNYRRNVPTIVGTADDPGCFLKTPNGGLWTFMATDSQIVAVKSTNDAASWSSPIIINPHMHVKDALVDAITFTSSTGANYIAVAVAENKSNSSAAYYFYIHNEAANDTAWIDESNNVGPLGFEIADNHLQLVVDKNNTVYMITKTSGGGANSPENNLYLRHADSTWSSYVVVNGLAWTRPALAIDAQHDSLYVIGSLDSGTQGYLVYKRCKLGEESTLAGNGYDGTIVMANGMDKYWNVSVPAHAVYDSTELMVIADDVTQGNVWFNRLPIGIDPGAPSYTVFDSTVQNFTLTKSGQDLQLTWSQNVDADSFVVYRATLPLFTADASSRLVMMTDTTYTDVGALGDPSVNHYYQVRAFVGGVGGPLSLRVGAYQFALVAPLGKKNNFVSMCLLDSALANASDLANRLGANCDLVSRWNTTAQAWGSYIPGLSFTDFALQFNQVYMVSVIDPDTLCLIGEVPTGHTYSLITTGGKNNNAMMVLMDTDTLTLASELATSIGPVDLVSRWTDSAQAYGSYIPGLSFTDFPIYPGEPLMVSVTADTTWPVR